MKSVQYITVVFNQEEVEQIQQRLRNEIMCRARKHLMSSQQISAEEFHKRVVLTGPYITTEQRTENKGLQTSIVGIEVDVEIENDPVPDSSGTSLQN